MRALGRAVKYGDNVNTDLILPGKYLTLVDPIELARHAMEGLDERFTEKAGAGAVLVAGRNFGCGSSREQAPIALKHAGVRCVLADSFARIFYRNAINVGLPALECEGISEKVVEGDEIVVDLGLGRIWNKSRGIEMRASPLPAFMLQIIRDGGLIQHLKKKCTA